MPNQTVKNGMKAKKIKLPQMNFFLKKQLIKFSCTLLRMCHFWAKNGPFVLNKFFLVQTIIITFIYLLALFIVQNLKKFLQRIQSYDNAQFLGPKWSICPKCFFGKLLTSFSSTYRPSHCAKFLKILLTDPEL